MSNSTLPPALPALTRVALAGIASTGVLMITPASADATPATTHPAQTAPATIVPGPTLRLTAKQRARLERAAQERRREPRERAREHRIATTRDGEVEHALRVALDHVGDPYVWGAAGPDAFDCSGLTSYAYAAAGLSIPRTAHEQAAYVRQIPRDQLRPGDFVFFSDGGYVYHVGLFLRWQDGTGVILHAPHPGASVREESIWTDDWFAGTMRTR